MRSVIETGARFLLDPRRKHEPTLLSEDRRRRIDFYKYAIDCAAELGSDCVSLWSGVRATDPSLAKRPSIAMEGEALMDRLVEGLREVLDYAAAKNVPIGFEPEPGMLIDTMRAFEEVACRGSTAPQPASDARHRPPALPGRNADRRSDSPLGAAAGRTSTSRTCAPAGTSI